MPTRAAALLALWRFLVGQDVPGIVLGTWLGAIPIWRWIERGIDRRHRERVAATDRHTAALTAYTQALTRPKED